MQCRSQRAVPKTWRWCSHWMLMHWKITVFLTFFMCTKQTNNEFVFALSVLNLDSRVRCVIIIIRRRLFRWDYIFTKTFLSRQQHGFMGAQHAFNTFRAQWNARYTGSGHALHFFGKREPVHFLQISNNNHHGPWTAIAARYWSLTACISVTDGLWPSDDRGRESELVFAKVATPVVTTNSSK